MRQPGIDDLDAAAKLDAEPFRGLMDAVLASNQERGAKPLAAVTFRHLGMVEPDRVRQQIVGGKGIFAVAEVDLEPVAGRIVDDGAGVVHGIFLARSEALAKMSLSTVT